MRSCDYQSVWSRILDHLIGDRRRYGSSSHYSFSISEMPKSVMKALRGKSKKRAGHGAMIAMALSAPTAKHYISEDCNGFYHWVYIIRILCKATKAAVDAHNRSHKRYMSTRWGPPLSPWSKWNDRNYEDRSTICNPYRQLIRNPMHEWKFQTWNNRKNKHKIRIMWKEYCARWHPWFSPKVLPDGDWTWRNPCVEKHHAYNVFRYYLTEEEFKTRWP